MNSLKNCNMKPNRCFLRAGKRTSRAEIVSSRDWQHHYKEGAQPYKAGSKRCYSDTNQKSHLERNAGKRRKTCLLWAFVYTWLAKSFTVLSLQHYFTHCPPLFLFFMNHKCVGLKAHTSFDLYKALCRVFRERGTESENSLWLFHWTLT